MKKKHKIFLYVSIPVVVIASVLIYNTLTNKPNLNAENSAPAKSGPGGQRSGGAGKSLPVSVYIAEFMSREDGRMTMGTLMANERVDVVSELSGRVTAINFREGQFVRKGEILIRLNDDELLTQLTKAEYQYTLLGQRLGRQKILLEKDAVSREEYDGVLTEYNVLKQDIEQLRIKIEKMKIRAPFDGVLGFREISTGAFLQPGSKISTLVDVASLKLEFSIPEKYINDIKSGENVIFTIEGMSNKFSAKIYAIDPEVELKTRTVMLRALYKNSSFKLKPGMSAKVTVNSANGAQNIYVPNQSVVPDVKGRSVWMLKEGKATLVPVQTGTRTADMLEVLSGIERGDTIITTGLMQLREGISVTPTNI